MKAIKMQNVTKSFGAVEAVKNVNFAVEKGVVRGLVGKNGAGKSTLVKILRGVLEPDTGSVEIMGSPRTESERLGVVSMIYQNFSLVPEMSVAENIFLNREPHQGLFIDDLFANNRVEDFFNDLNIDIDPNKKVKKLQTGEMQLVEIVKALLNENQILVMDEPTAALDSDETEKLFELVRELRSAGITVIIVTHYLEHIQELCDSVTILRSGEKQITEKIENLNTGKIISFMLGDAEYSEQERDSKAKSSDEPLLQVSNITSPESPEPISFQLYPGEVVGIAGLKGSGRTELLNSLFGIDPIISGDISIEGEDTRIDSPKDAIENGIMLVPENRQAQGLILPHSLYSNVTLPILDQLSETFFLNDKKGLSLTRELIERIEIKTETPYTDAKQLSGGNQQKVVVAKSLATEPKILLLDDPTYGIDVHAKVEIMNLIDELASSGTGIIFVSSELEQLSRNCDRIFIMKDNKITDEFTDVLDSGVGKEEVASAMNR